MEIRQISVTYGRKTQLRQFESLHSEVTLWADIKEGEDPNACLETLKEVARQSVEQELAQRTERTAPKTQEIFAGLPVEAQKEIKQGEERQRLLSVIKEEMKAQGVSIPALRKMCLEEGLPASSAEMTIEELEKTVVLLESGEA